MGSGNNAKSSETVISTQHMENLVHKYLNKQIRESTSRTYLKIWRQFNQFIVKLDVMPPTWEARATLYIAYLIDCGKQSSSIKTCVSAIKKLLLLDNYDWKDNEVLLNSLTKSCRLVNDKVTVRLPIQHSLFEMILFEIERIYPMQVYLQYLYKAIFVLCYYCMMRVGEVTYSPHVLLAKNVHIAKNKNKLLFLLYSSKTHGKSHRPQKIKITESKSYKVRFFRHFCPFVTLKSFLKLRGCMYGTEDEHFFIYQDKQMVKATQVTNILKLCIKSIRLDNSLYSIHSFRIGRTSDLIKLKYPIDVIKRLGRCKSNAVYKYIRYFHT